MSSATDTGSLQVREVWKRYHLSGTSGLLRSLLLPWRGEGADVLWALRDLSFEVNPGESLALIGCNGAGKSTVLKLLAGIMAPTRGRVQVSGRVGCLIEVGAGFHPELTGRENIFLNGAVLGIPRRQLLRRLDAIVAYAGLERFLDVPVKRYSTGMFMRLGFSVAVHSDPHILLVDEVLAVGDQAFQRRCLETIDAMRRRGVAIVLVSHNFHNVLTTCARAIWLDQGRARLQGQTADVVRAYEEHLQEQQARALETDRGREGERVRIREAGFPGHSPESCPAFPVGRDLSVELTVEVFEPVPQPILCCGVRRQDGVACAASNTRVEGQPLDPLPAGLHRFRVDLPEVRLVPALYRLDLQVADALRGTLAERSLPFRTVSLQPNLDPEHYGLFLLTQRWSRLEDPVGAGSGRGSYPSASST